MENFLFVLPEREEPMSNVELQMAEMALEVFSLFDRPEEITSLLVDINDAMKLEKRPKKWDVLYLYLTYLADIWRKNRDTIQEMQFERNAYRFSQIKQLKK